MSYFQLGKRVIRATISWESVSLKKQNYVVTTLDSKIVGTNDLEEADVKDNFHLQLMTEETFSLVYGLSIYNENSLPLYESFLFKSEEDLQLFLLVLAYRGKKAISALNGGRY